MPPSKPDLDAFSVAELTTLIADAKAAREARMDDAKHNLLVDFTSKAEALGLRVEDLFPGHPMSIRRGTKAGRKQRKDAGQPAAVKFRGPNGEEWSGRGRRPRWIAETGAKGKQLADFAV